MGRLAKGEGDEEAEQVLGGNRQGWKALRDFVRENRHAPQCIALRLLQTPRQSDSRGRAAVMGVLGTARTGLRLHAEATLQSLEVSLGASGLPPIDVKL